MKNIDFLSKLNISANNLGNFDGNSFLNGEGQALESYSPVDAKLIGIASLSTPTDYNTMMLKCQKAFKSWRKKPAPLRGEIVRQMGEAFRLNKMALGQLVSYEMGKSLQEGLGEVQEVIDICDFAVGLSRQLHGLTMHSERPNHRMLEQWHPYGVVGVISAFNFPVAVWSWNTMIALVCGNTTIWKPSEKTPLCGIACMNIIKDVLVRNNVEEGVVTLVQGNAVIGELMANDTRLPVVSATGSTRMGKEVAKNVAARLGKSILELGGNNAIIVTPNTDLKILVPGVVFGAMGTCGQRCTSTRRLIVHNSILEIVKNTLVNAYGQLVIGSPLDEKNHMGPLIDLDAVSKFIEAMKKIPQQGGEILCGGEVLEREGSNCYVSPCIAMAPADAEIVHTETFAPILYIHSYDSLEEAIDIQNSVPQGLSSAIFTSNLLESEQFLSAWGSDCGIANVNIGTSGAEIGGAFGGEKETGGGRESGSDAWKGYMRRQTCTINYGTDLPLAQGIKFELN
ncbi:MAG: aldehyde dehydrogenase (NAD+) [Algoriphagus sp.]|jgi:aldehyde dehydrogenase (NAD+)